MACAVESKLAVISLTVRVYPFPRKMETIRHSGSSWMWFGIPKNRQKPTKMDKIQRKPTKSNKI